MFRESSAVSDLPLVPDLQLLVAGRNILLSEEHDIGHNSKYDFRSRVNPRAIHLMAIDHLAGLVGKRLVIRC